MIKPVRIMNQEGVYDLERKAVMNGIYNVLMLTAAGSNGLVNLYDWKTEEHKNADSSLKPHQSVDWYIEQGRIASERKGLLNASALLSALSERAPRDGGSSYSWKKKKPYEILVHHEEIYTSFNGEIIFLNGLAARGEAAVISTYASRRGEQKEAYQNVRSLAMHEMGHILGLIPNERIENVKYTPTGRHCVNECVMQSHISVIQPKADFLGRVLGQEQKVIYDAFCPTCLQDLKKLS